MSDFMDGLENAAAKLREMGKKAVESAGDAIESARPAVEKGISSAVEGAKDLYERVRPSVEAGWDKVTDAAGDIVERAKPAVEGAWEKVSGAVTDAAGKVVEGARDLMDGDAPGADGVEGATPAPKKGDAIDQQVAEQVDAIRRSETAESPFAQYIEQKYGKHEAEEEAPEEPTPEDGGDEPLE